MDTISRQAAINALTSHIMPHNNEDGTVTIGVLSKSSIKNILNKLPSAQPEKHTEERTETHACDCISRQAAIEIASGFCHPANIAKELAKLPSAQPEIVRCKECIMHDVCRFEQGLGVDGYCSQAERRTDEAD